MATGPERASGSLSPSSGRPNGAAGRPLPFVRVEIRDSGGRALGPGHEGEIVVHGPTVAEAYFDDRQRTDRAFERRWFHTGDIGVWDGEGRLRVLDRRSDRMVVGGENVSPLEVEAAIALHPSVAEVCVVALEAGSWGHEVAAAVVCRPGASVTLDEIKEHPYVAPKRPADPDRSGMGIREEDK